MGEPTPAHCPNQPPRAYAVAAPALRAGPHVPERTPHTALRCPGAAPTSGRSSGCTPPRMPLAMTRSSAAWSPASARFLVSMAPCND
jgi:hypothetical protein